VNCTWADPPVLSTTPKDASVAVVIQNLLQDKNVLIDYGLKAQSTKQCFDESLK
jgi:hypothetical protein